MSLDEVMNYMYYLKAKKNSGRCQPLSAVDPVSNGGTQHDDSEAPCEPVDGHQSQVIVMESHHEESPSEIPHPVTPGGQCTGEVHLVRNPRLGYRLLV